VFSFFGTRRNASPSAKPSKALPVVAPVAAAMGPVASCQLDACAVGRRATVLDVGCGEAEACRLRALGLCEGASVWVLDAPRHCTLIDVRGSRLALGSALSAAITVLPLQS